MAVARQAFGAQGFGHVEDDVRFPGGLRLQSGGRGAGGYEKLAAGKTIAHSSYNKIFRANLMQFLTNSLLELITQTSTNLPPDVRAAMSLAAGGETPATQSAQALGIILSNIDMAADDE